MTTARSRSLGVEVRTLRKEADLRLEELAERCGWSRATLGRIEAGNKVPSETEIAIVLGTLGITGSERTRMLELAQDVHQPHWWETGYTGIPTQLGALMEFERTATKITDVSLALVPGLLQTADYTRAIIGSAGIRGDALEARVSLRLGRQSVLTRKDPVAFQAFLDEAALYRPVGGYAVMAEQLRHIVRAAQRDRVTVQVLPLKAGEHLALTGSHMLLEFQRQRSIVHLEHRRSSIFLDTTAETSPYFEAIASLTEVALAPNESTEFIATRAEKMEKHDLELA